MLHLYTSPQCPYCRKVEAYLDGRAIPYEIRDVSTKPEFRDTVVSLGGNLQVPFLVDTEQNVHLYESDDIITYIGEHYDQSPTTDH